ncbi:MAG TPA: SMC-Scp complex subunit ScpB [Patescibacteria group bacterium]|nr:SMC-Scp complex subunit ScpB [Patescibacteria group bacterium]
MDTQEQTIESTEGAAEVVASAGGLESIRVLEAMLFASSAPLTLNAMRERLPADADVGGMLMELQQTYAKRGVTLVDLDGAWAFRTATDLGEALQISRDVKRKLSRAAMETLAIVAYHQPVTRAEIENIRGVETNRGTLDVLIEAGWVKPGRRRETPGRPVTWVTTTSFMDHFGLEALTDLPGLDDLKASGLLDRRPALEALPTTGSLFPEDEIAAAEDAEAEAEDEEEYEDDEESEDEEEAEESETASESEDEFSEDDEEFEDDEDDEEDGEGE